VSWQSHSQVLLFASMIGDPEVSKVNNAPVMCLIQHVRARVDMYMAHEYVSFI